MVETSVCFHAKSSKDSIHSIILGKKKCLKSLKDKEKNNKSTMCDVAASYDAHACSLYVFLRGWIHIQICQTSHTTYEPLFPQFSYNLGSRDPIHITQNAYGSGGALIWVVMESGCALVKKCGSAPKQNLNESYFFEIST